MKDVNLSKRMEAVVSMVSPQSFTIADVGCDHAYVSIALINRKLATKVIAMDVGTGPLNIARTNITEAGYGDIIDIRLGDGLEKLKPGEADGIIIAGMGGLLIKGILERGADILSYETKRPVLILQPQSDIKEIRMFLHKMAYHIVAEKMLVEDGKYYTIIKAEPNDCEMDNIGADEEAKGSLECLEAYTEEDYVYGKCNLENQSGVLLEYLQKERTVLKQIFNKVEASITQSKKKGESIPNSTSVRLESVRQELEINARALQLYDTCIDRKLEGGLHREM